VFQIPTSVYRLNCAGGMCEVSRVNKVCCSVGTVGSRERLGTLWRQSSTVSGREEVRAWLSRGTTAEDGKAEISCLGLRAGRK